MATIQGVYVALFGRPADPAGLAYFNGITNNGANLSSIASLAGTAEYQARFANQSNTQIVSAIYQSLFNRAPEAAGLSFFVDALNKGTLNINNVAIAILDGAQGDDKIVITNKLTAADNFTKALDTPTEIGAYQGNAAAAQGRTFLAGVTKDTTTIPSAAATDAAVLAVVTATPGSTGTAGVSIDLTTGNDTVSASQANPSFKSTAGDDTIKASATIANGAGPGATVTSTLNAGDNINGDAGTDTLTYSATGVAATATTAGQNATIDLGQPTITNVEKIFITAVGGASTVNGAGNAGVLGSNVSVTLDLDKSSGYKELWSDGSASGATASFGTAPNTTTVAGGTSTVTYNNIATGTALGLKGTNDTVVYSFKTTTSSSDAATINLTAATAKSVSVSGIENVTFALTGNSTVSSLTDNQLDKVVVTGTGNFSLTTEANATLVKTVDASALNGTLTVNVASAVNGVTVTGTKFADAITLHTGDTTDKDVIVFNSSNLSTAAATDSITNFTTAEDKLDVKAYGLTAPTNINVLNANTTPLIGATLTTIAATQVGADTMVYVDRDKSGAFDANDLVIKLVGFTATDLKVADFTFA